MKREIFEEGLELTKKIDAVSSFNCLLNHLITSEYESEERRVAVGRHFIAEDKKGTIIDDYEVTENLPFEFVTRLQTFIQSYEEELEEKFLKL